jgi:hypothetical protein
MLTLTIFNAHLSLSFREAYIFAIFFSAFCTKRTSFSAIFTLFYDET